MISTLTRLPDSDSKMSQWKLNVAHVAHTIFFFLISGIVFACVKGFW